MNLKSFLMSRIDAFELWCWRRLLRVLWTSRRSNQSILKEISPDYSLEGLMLKLKLQYFGHPMQRTDSLEKTLMLGKVEGRRRRGRQRMRWLWVWVDSDSWWWIGRPGVLQFMGSQRVRDDWVTKLNWLNWVLLICFSLDLFQFFHSVHILNLVEPFLLRIRDAFKVTRLLTQDLYFASMTSFWVLLLLLSRISRVRLCATP